MRMAISQESSATARQSDSTHHHCIPWTKRSWSFCRTSHSMKVHRHYYDRSRLRRLQCRSSDGCLSRTSPSPNVSNTVYCLDFNGSLSGTSLRPSDEFDWCDTPLVPAAGRPLVPSSGLQDVVCAFFVLLLHDWSVCF